MTTVFGEPELEPRYPGGVFAAGLIIVVLTLVAGMVAGNLMSFLDSVFIAFIGFVTMTAVGMRMARPIDGDWLPTFVAWGFVAKIAFSCLRYWVLMVVYHGSGDAVGYHGSGLVFVGTWRNFQIPAGITGGTEFVDRITGLIYVPYIPTMIGGFFMFATLAFIGQLFMYAAFRQSDRPRRLKWYAAVIFFLPAISYWPASIGKESLMFLGLGMAVYGAARLLHRGGIKPLFYVGAGLAFAGAIRPHVAALVIGALAVTLLIAKGRSGLGISSIQRLAAIIVVGVGSLFVINAAATEFNIDLADVSTATTDVDGFVSNLEGNTSKGGSEVTGSAVSSPVDLPEATLRVLFRPLVNEAHNAPAMASALESTTLLLLVIWRLPWIIRNTLRVREDPYIMMCLIMTLGFVIMFSPFLNLGLLARERSQILPFVAAAIIQLGWNFVADEESEPVAVTETGVGLQPV